MDIVERLTSHWGGERCVDVSIDVADAIDEIERLRKTLRQIIELNPFNSNTGNVSIQYVTQMLVKMTALAHEALKEKE